MNKQHVRIMEEIRGGFGVFIMAVLCVYFAIEIIKALPGVNFPISTNSAWFISLVLGLLVGYAAYVKKKARAYYSR